MNEDDARAALQRVFISILSDPAKAPMLAAFYTAHSDERPMAIPDPVHQEAAERLAVEAEASFDALTTTGFDEWVEGRVVLVEFSAEWCGPCRTMAPLLRDVAAELDLPVGLVDADEEPRLVERFDVKGLPTVLLLEDGAELQRVVGATRGRETLADYLRNSL